ncbi:MAG: response regulator [Candidatus Omnitrophota bacterium]|jgi:two-component system alkaline phosphatase synthesis response regulator PhoP
MKKEKKILIVEDDKHINELISYNLSRNGFVPESVYDGFQAHDRLEKEVFDIVILDIMLPGIDGFHICRDIKKNPAAFKTFVVILTAKAESQDKIYGNLMGADHYITKPFSVAQLMDVIRELTAMRDKEFFVAPVGAVNAPAHRKGG